MIPFEPLVTVYIVNHNYGRFVEQAINSVLDQTLQDFELIIIDNGSSDNSREIIEKFSQHRKILAIFQDNRVLSTANNTALGLAKGKYIMRLDADDFLDKHALDVMSQALDRSPDVGLVSPDYYLADEDGEVIEIVRRQAISKTSLLDLPAHGACTMTRRECLLALEGYNEAYSCQDGWDLWLRFIEHYGVSNVNLPLFYYRKHSDNLTNGTQHIHATRADILSYQAAKRKRSLDCITVVPVRGQNIDPQSLALRPLAGKPLINWTLDAAIEAKRTSKILVTSSDPDVLEHVTDHYGDKISTFHRNWRLALFSSPLDASLTDLFQSLPDRWRTFDAVSVLYIESPFRTARYIDMAVDVLDIFNLNRVVGMYRETDTFYRHGGNGMEAVRTSETVRAEHEEFYRLSGGLFVIRRGHWFRDNILDKRVGHVELDEAAALSVDTKWAWSIAEMHAETLMAGQTKGIKLMEKLSK